VDKFAAFSPFSSFNSKNLFGTVFSKEVISLREVITKRRNFAFFSNIINIEVRAEGISKDCCNKKLTEFQSNWPES